MKRICKVCNGKFTILPSYAKRGWGNACSRVCQYILARTGKNMNCLVCNKEFYAKKADIKKGNRGKYCSRDCFINDPIKRKREKKCFICKKILLRGKHAIKNYKRFFCSKKCIGKSLIREIGIKCTKCKVKFNINPSQKSKNNYCSMKCRRLEVGKCVTCNESKIVRSSGMCKKCHTADNNIKRNYGITLFQANKYKTAGCKICGSKKRLFIDHDHKTGKFRGILCSNCNFLLGASVDSIKILKSAIKYLIPVEEVKA